MVEVCGGGGGLGERGRIIALFLWKRLEDNNNNRWHLSSAMLDHVCGKGMTTLLPIYGHSFLFLHRSHTRQQYTWSNGFNFWEKFSCVSERVECLFTLTCNLLIHFYNIYYEHIMNNADLGKSTRTIIHAHINMYTCCVYIVDKHTLVCVNMT